MPYRGFLLPILKLQCGVCFQKIHQNSSWTLWHTRCITFENTWMAQSDQTVLPCCHVCLTWTWLCWTAFLRLVCRRLLLKSARPKRITEGFHCSVLGSSSPPSHAHHHPPPIRTIWAGYSKATGSQVLLFRLALNTVLSSSEACCRPRSWQKSTKSNLWPTPPASSEFSNLNIWVPWPSYMGHCASSWCAKLARRAYMEGIYKHFFVPSNGTNHCMHHHALEQVA